MKIETKFDIFDYVYFIIDKKIHYGRVGSIIFEEDGAEDILFVYHIKWDGFSAYLREKQLFATKEEAEEKLKEIKNESNND